MREEERRSGPVSSGPDIPVGWSGGPVIRSGPVWSSLVLSWSGPVWSGLDWSGPFQLVWSGPVWSGVWSSPSGLVQSGSPVRSLVRPGRCSPCFVGRNTTLCWLVHSFVSAFW